MVTKKIREKSKIPTRCSKVKMQAFLRKNFFEKLQNGHF